jgi:checkpoint serine/threonine-protein kinase
VRSAEEVFTKIRAPALSEADQLKHDPLRNFDTSQMTAALPTLPDAPLARKAPRPKPQVKGFVIEPWTCPTDGPEVKDPKGKTQKRMFAWDKVFKGGEEWSFEEVRARERGLFGKEWRGEVQAWEREWHAPGCESENTLDESSADPQHQHRRRR